MGRSFLSDYTLIFISLQNSRHKHNKSQSVCEIENEFYKSQRKYNGTEERLTLIENTEFDLSTLELRSGVLLLNRARPNIYDANESNEETFPSTMQMRRAQIQRDRCTCRRINGKTFRKLRGPR